MKKEEFTKAMDNVRADYIEEAATFKRRTALKWQSAIAIAACLCLVVGAGIFALPRLTGNSPVECSDGNSIAGNWELNAALGENKTEVVYTVNDGNSENKSYVKCVDNSVGEVYDDATGSDSSEADATEQPVTENGLASDFSAMVETAPSPEVNFTLIPAYHFLYEEDLTDTDTDKPFYWNAVSYIYGTHFIDAGVGDFIPVGVYVSNDGTSCYVIDKKSDGTSTKTLYSILGDESEDYKVISVDTYSN